MKNWYCPGLIYTLFPQDWIRRIDVRSSGPSPVIDVNCVK